MNPTDTTLLDLLIKRDSEGLSPEETDWLCEALENDPAARETLVMHYLIRVGTKKAARAKAAALNRRNRSRFSMRAALPALAAAAALLILAGVWIANRTGANGRIARAVLILDETAGEVQFVRAGRPIAARAGMRFRPGDSVRVLGASQATLSLTEPTGPSDRFLLADNAHATWSGVEPDLRIVLRSGRLEAEIEKRTVAPPSWSVETAHMRLTALGTRFLVATDTDVTRTRVTEGVVEMIRLSDGKTARIEAGHYAVATTDHGRLPSGPYTPGMLIDGRVLFRESFDQGWRPEIWNTFYYDNAIGRYVEKDLYGGNLFVVTNAPGSDKANAIEIAELGKTGNQIILAARSGLFKIPGALALEFDVFQPYPSNFTFLNIGGTVHRIYGNARAQSMRNQAVHRKEWWRTRLEIVHIRHADGTFAVDNKEYLNGDYIGHVRHEGIRDPNSDTPPRYLFFSLLSGRVRFANIVVYERIPLD